MLKPTALPWTKLSDRAFPSSPGVYFCLTPENEVLYVGSSENLKARFRAHHRMFDLVRSGCERIYYQTVKTEHRHILRELEQAYIKHFNPYLNSIR